MNQAIFAIAKDADGVIVLSRERLNDNNGGFTLVPTGIHQLAVAMFPKRANLQRLEAVCIATGIAPATFIVRGISGSSISLKTLNTGKAPAAGDRFVWEFPTPIQSNPTSTQPLRIEVPTTSPSCGFWFVTAEGFYSTIPQDT